MTIVGGNATGTSGVRVQSDENKHGVIATLANSVIEGPATALQIWSGNGREAKLSASYSNFDPSRVEVKTDVGGSGPAGTSAYSSSNVTDLSPDFADPNAGDYELAAGSPLIDIGDPATPAAGQLDLVGQPRALPGVCNGLARRDIGAYEAVPICPPLSGPASSATGSPATPSQVPLEPSPVTRHPSRTAPPEPAPDTEIKLRKKRWRETSKGRAIVTFVLHSTATDASFRCRVDGKPYRTCGSNSFFALGPGKHMITAIATSGAGIADPTPATAIVIVVREKRR